MRHWKLFTELSARSVGPSGAYESGCPLRSVEDTGHITPTACHRVCAVYLGIVMKSMLDHVSRRHAYGMSSRSC